MSETAIFLMILVPMVILFLVKEVAFNVFPASHWINQILNRPGSTDAGGGDWFDCDGGDGGD